MRHAVDERLDPDEADRRLGRGAIQQMLAAAEADLQSHLGHICFEQAGQRLRGRCGKVDPVSRQEFRQRAGLQRPNRLAAPATEKRLGRPAAPFGAHRTLKPVARTDIRATRFRLWILMHVVYPKPQTLLGDMHWSAYSAASLTSAAPTASFSALTRSVFSQAKEPSRPGLRPKWP